MTVRLLTLALLLSSCFLSVDKTPINTPTIDADYYKRSIQVLEEALEDQPDYVPFIQLQLGHYEQLGWPEEAALAIARAEKYLINDPVFFEQKISYYRINGKYQELATALQQYEVADQLSLSIQFDFLEALIQLNKSEAASQLINQLLLRVDSSYYAQLLGEYLRIKDTASVVSSIDTLWMYLTPSFVHEYYVKPQFDDQSWSRLITISERSPEIFDYPPSSQVLGKSYLALDSLQTAVEIFVRDTTYDGQVLLAETYEQQYKLLSASRVIDAMLLKNPLNTDLLKRRALLADRRGYYETAILYFNRVLSIDSLDQDASIGVRKITDKIAYLRQQKEKNRIMPILGLDSLKKGM